MAGESDKSIDTAQAELVTQAPKETTGVIKGIEDVFKSGGLVDTFQALDKTLKLEASPAAMEHFEKGKGEVAGMVLKMAARGKYLVDNPAPTSLEEAAKMEKQKEKKPYDSSENIEALASSVRSTLNRYKEQLTPISQILEKRREAFPHIMEVDTQFRQFEYGYISSKDCMQYIDNALSGTDGTDGLCGIWKLINNNAGLPKEFVDEMNINFSQKRMSQLMDLKVQLAQENLTYDEKYVKYVTITRPKKPGEKATVTFTAEGEKLPQKKKQEILMALAGVQVAVQEQMEAATCPKITERFWAGKTFFEAGRFEDAKAQLEEFLRTDLTSLSSDKNLKGKKDSYEKQAREILSQIEKVSGTHKDFFEAQKLAQSGDVIGAKKLLKSYLEGHKEMKEGEGDFTASAQELLKRIALVQVADVKEKFKIHEEPKKKILVSKRDPHDPKGTILEEADNPEYHRYVKYRDALAQIEKDVSAGKYVDFTDAYNALAASAPGGFDAKDDFNMLADQVTLDKGRDGIIELARKYREKGKYFGDPKYLHLAEQYFTEYFGPTLNETAKKYVTIEKLREKYAGSVRFAVEVKDKLDEAKKEYDKTVKNWNERWPDDPWEKKHPWDEIRAREAIVDQSLAAIQREETLKQQNSFFNLDPKNVGGAADQAAWGEFMNMKGMHGQGKWNEPFAMSDEQVGRMVKELPVDIAIIAASGAIAAATGGAASALVIEAGMSIAERQALAFGVRSALRQFAAYGAGLLVETTVFTASHSVLQGVRTGQFNITSMETFQQEWFENLKIMGVLGLAGRASMALNLGKVSSFGVEMAAMGSLHGKLTMDDFAMVAGLKIAHFRPKKGKTEKPKTTEEKAAWKATEKAMSLDAAAKKAREAADAFKAKTGKESAKLEAAAVKASGEAKSAHEAASGKLGTAIEADKQRAIENAAEAGNLIGLDLTKPENIKTVRITEDGQVIINGKTNKKITVDTVLGYPPEVAGKIFEAAQNTALDTHYYSAFDARVPEGLPKDTQGWIDKEGKIHFNLNHFNAGTVAGPDGKPQRILPEGYKALTDANGNLRIRTPEGKELSLKKYEKSMKGSPHEGVLLKEMIAVKNHESTHRTLEFAFTTEVTIADGTVTRVPDKAKAQPLIDRFAKPDAEGNVPEGKIPLVDVKGKPMEPTWENVQEYLCHVGDGSIRVTKAELKSLEASIGKNIPEFSFARARRITTKDLAQNPAAAFARLKAAAREGEVPEIELRGPLPVESVADISRALESPQTAREAKKLVQDLMALSMRVKTIDQIKAEYPHIRLVKIMEMASKLRDQYKAEYDAISSGLSEAIAKKKINVYAEFELTPLQREMMKRILEETKDTGRLLGSNKADGTPKTPAEKQADLQKLKLQLRDGSKGLGRFHLEHLLASENGKKILQELMKEKGKFADDLSAKVNQTYADQVLTVRENLRSGKESFEKLPADVKERLKLDTARLLREKIAQISDEKQRKELEAKFTPEKTAELLDALEKHQPPKGFDGLPKLTEILYANADRLGAEYFRQILEDGEYAKYSELKVYENGVEKSRKILSFEGKLLGSGGFGDVFEAMVFDSKSTRPKEIVVKKPRTNVDLPDLAGFEQLDASERAMAKVIIDEFISTGVTKPDGFEKIMEIVNKEFTRPFNRSMYEQLLRLQFAHDEVQNSKLVMKLQSEGRLEGCTRVNFVAQNGTIYLDSMSIPKIGNKLADFHGIMEGKVTTLDGTHPITREQFWGSMANIMDALAGMHRQGIVHRDIKPENMGIGPDGKIRIFDFGSLRTKDNIGQVPFIRFDVAAGEIVPPNIILPQHENLPVVFFPSRGGITPDFYRGDIAWSESTGKAYVDGAKYKFGASDTYSMAVTLEQVVQDFHHSPDKPKWTTRAQVIKLQDLATRLKKPDADLAVAARELRDIMRVP